jgi:uncharacterized integral membrane protein (TIGR00697 family)
VPNEVLFFLTIVASYGGILVAFRLFGRPGLYAWTVLAVLLANIEVLKLVRVFGFETALGNVIYATTFLSTDILTERYGRRDAWRAVGIGFFSLVALTVLSQLALGYRPAEGDTASPALQHIFGFLPRIALASLTAYAVAQSFDVWFFGWIRRRTGPGKVWLRNNVATMSAQLLDNVVFSYIAWVGLFGLFGWERVFPWPTIASIFVTSYFLKWIAAVCDTPFLYLARILRAPDIEPGAPPSVEER